MTVKKRRKLKPYKISRGSFEEQQLREDNRMQTQRALLIILPVVMVAILLVGLYFGYMNYRKQNENIRTVEHSGATVPEPTEANPMMLTVVTSAFPLSADDVPALTDCGGIRVAPEVREPLTQLLAAAREAGHEIKAAEGYISFEEQRERYQTAVEEYRKKAKVSLVKAEATVRSTTPREGESEQQTGFVVYLSADTEGKFEDSAAYAWLRKNCTAYGFILRYPSAENTGGLKFSAHLFRYVGQENAYYITAYDMTFDAYVAYLSAR